MTRRRTPSDEEIALWRHVTKDVKRRVRNEPPSPPEARGTRQDASKPTARRTGLAAKGSPGGNPGAAAASTKPRRRGASPPALGAGDPAVDRRVRRGAVAVEATLDLHGLTQIAAEGRLAAFIARAYASGKRCVLVITGKGARDGTAGEARGVIRARFVEWIDAPQTRERIARVAPAAARHGGRGAFYVLLKAPGSADKRSR